MRHGRRILWALVACVTGAGCDEGTTPERPEVELGRQLAQLQPIQGCDELQTSLRTSALAWMNAELDARLQRALEGSDYCLEDDSAGGVPTAGPAPSAGAANGAKSYSTTNTQEADVDEADVLKNDGEHLYLLAAGKLQIVDAWPPEQAHVVSATAIEGTPRKLFVEADRAIVFSSLEGKAGETVADSARSMGPGGGEKECTYGYSCSFTGDGRPLKVTVLDLQDRAAPKLLRELRYSGSLVGTRRIGDAVHTVVSAPEIQFPGLALAPQNVPYSSCSKPTESEQEAIVLAYAELRAKNTALIQAAQLSDWLPNVTDVRYTPAGVVTQANLLTSCEGFYASKAKDGAAFLIASSFDLSSSKPLALTTVIGKPGAVYASSDALYVAARQTRGQSGGWYFEDSGNEATTIHKFALMNGPKAVYQGSGVVKGRILNPFALDEHQGHLRIATTTGRLPSPDVFSTVTVLAQGSEGLVEVGSLGPLAPGEDIRSVRFEGEEGYLVTFKKTDPLFVLDLSNPLSPRVQSELKIPGFSTYLHKLGKNHLIAIGYDADDRGDFAYFQGVLLQIFDVSDPLQPVMTHRKVLGTRGSSSEALTNHLAFNYFAPKGLLALPLTQCEGSSGGGSYGTQVTFSGLKLFDVSTTTGFTDVGGISHPLPDSSAYACSNWWTEATSYVKRSVFLDDYVVSIAEDELRVQKLGQLGTDLARVTFTP